MKRSPKTIVLCFLALSVCGKASTPNPDDERGERGERASEQHREMVRAAPKHDDQPSTARRPPRRQESSPISSVSALEHFEHDLDSATELLSPFADGTKDPRARLDTVREIYREKLYPLDEFLSNYLRDHRDELSDDTRQSIGRVIATVSGLNVALLAPEDPARPHGLEDFISNTLDSIEEIRPLLRRLDAPGDPP